MMRVLSCMAFLLLSFLLGPLVWADDVKPVELARAMELLRDLERRLDDPERSNKELIASLDAIAQAFGRLIPDPLPCKGGSGALSKGQRRLHQKRFEAGQRKFRARTESLLVKALVLKRVSSRAHDNERHDVNLRAARALRRMSPSSSSLRT